uniref:Vault protein inter-alpha-trypsin domain-containing protein n=1 Tax=Candidatus Kentrum sp. MB TaxID=2138164 RepID=A0A450XPP7_9GAMM|nr:MAG: hypothetical protein BECKMB1821G_GA0114241_10249 [Candidatus Kentron sp. MB]VFK31169.1 MAG: hypothetical protein BECKMB1821I_GA0114274_10218 [Candidatus Kentron sp. MB]VFK75375.1 MAG: hypothetical protein BECKMB1821H_GA0114242_10219 [Candidatus Kentron sp. MB]
MNENSQLITQGDVALSYRTLLGEVRNDNYSQIRLINEHYLLDEGHVKRVVDVVIRSNVAELTVFHWRVPLHSNRSKLSGIRVDQNHGIKSYRVVEEKDSLKRIDIALSNLKKGETLNIKFEYYVTYSCNTRAKGVFVKEFLYPFAYKPVTDTKALELRLHIPRNANFRIDSNLPANESLIVDKNRIIIATEEKFSTGDISGILHVEHRTQAYAPFISLFIGILFTCIVSVIQYKAFFGTVYYALLPVLSLAAILLAKKLFSE